MSVTKTESIAEINRLLDSVMSPADELLCEAVADFIRTSNAKAIKCARKKRSPVVGYNEMFEGIRKTLTDYSKFLANWRDVDDL